MKGKGKFVLHQVPNNAEGKALLNGIRLYLNRAEYEIIVRGNGPRSAPAVAAGRGPKGYDQSLPLAKSTHFRVYIEPKATSEQCAHHSAIIAHRGNVISDLTAALNRSRDTLAQTQSTLDTAKTVVVKQAARNDDLRNMNAALRVLAGDCQQELEALLKRNGVLQYEATQCATANKTLRDRMFADQQHLMAIPKWIRRFFQPKHGKE